MIKKILLALIVALVIIQFIRPAKNISSANTGKEITTVYPVPANVQAILWKACYDCHSNSSYYPWYSNIQPVGWWMNHHIEEGKEELNFSEFGNYPLQKQVGKLRKSADEVEEGEMPLESYVWQHSNARLTVEEKQAYTRWAQQLATTLAAKLPPETK